MPIEIIKEIPDFNKSPHGKRKRVVVVKFSGCYHKPSGKEFKWIPSYKELKDISIALREIEWESWDKNS